MASDLPLDATRRPLNCNAALVMDGKLVVIDGVGKPWAFTADGDGPDSADAAFKLNDKLVVISGGTSWMYSFADGEWTKGVEINKPVEGQEEGPWQYGPNVEDVDQEAKAEKEAEKIKAAANPEGEATGKKKAKSKEYA